MRKGSRRRFSIEGKPLYPHIKLTPGRFPRLLATRLIATDGAEYFGAFLNGSNARILIDFLNRTFRLRSCEIDIDGSFNYPCTMHYKRRCIAPCVADLTDEKAYAEMVGLVRLFLLNDRPLFESAVRTKIEAASEELDFEAAGKWRDILEAVHAYWADTRRSVWLDETSDTFSFRSTDLGLDIFLTSQKGRRVLGERVFSFPDAMEADAPEAISDVIDQFYRSHAPKEIRVAGTCARKEKLEADLLARFGRRVPIVPVTEKNRKISTELAVYRSSVELDVERLIEIPTPKQLSNEIKKQFRSPKAPSRITAVDVSHTGGTNQVAAAIVWSDGRTIGSAYRLYNEVAEPEALAKFAAEALHETDGLLLIDGGAAQLNAVLRSFPSGSLPVIAAVKPPDDHSAISPFLTADGRKIPFDISAGSHRLLQRLRDEVHEFANAIHRDTRDFAGFYAAASLLPSLTETERRRVVRAVGSVAAILSISEDRWHELLPRKRALLAIRDLQNYEPGQDPAVLPLVVPVHFQDQYGAAEDLRPIEASHRLSRKPISRA